QALGVTMQLPLDDRHNYSRDYLEKTLTVLLGGRIAEELVLNQMTTGAGNDIERVTKMARKMVCEWGMSESLGPLAVGENDDQVFLGRELGHHKDYSEETARLVDSEVKRLIQEAYDRGRGLLQDNLAVLHSIAEALLDHETLTNAEVDLLMRGEKLPPPPNGAGGGLKKQDEGKPGEGGAPEEDSDSAGESSEDPEADSGEEDEDKEFKLEE
ncbi:MAG: cell division protein FtsH, partial [Desulfonatronovibrionaceae bacterium]